VILLSSAHIESDTLAEGLEQGADCYITKPIPDRELQARVKTALKLKLAERRLRQSEEQFRGMFEKHNAIMLLIEPVTGRIINANEAAERFYGYTLSQLRSMSIQDINILPPDEVEREFNLAIQERRNYFVFPHRLANGEVRTVEVHSSPVEQNDEKFLFSIIHDITDRKRAEESLKIASAYNRTLFETSPDALVTISAEGKLTDVNTATERFTGFSRDELIGTDFSDYFTDPEKARAGYQQVFRDGSVKDYELELRDKNGPAAVVLYNASVYRDESGKVMGIFAAARDVTGLKEAERQLREFNETLEKRVAERSAELMAANRQLLREIEEHAVTTTSLRDSETRLRMVIESSPIGIFVIKEGKYSFANQALMTIFGLADKSDIVRKAPETPFGDVSGRQFSVILKQCLGRSETLNVNEFKVLTRDQRERHLNIWLQPIELSGFSVVMGFVIDVSDEIELRKHLNQAQKMEALRSLAGGIAHDFNNVLFGITGYTELALSETSIEPRLKKQLEHILGAAGRASELVKQILTFSRGREQEKQPLIMSPIVKESLNFLRASITQNIEIRRDVRANLQCVNADPTQIHQIIMNLATNAYHSMKDTGGVLDVSLEQVELTPDFVRTRPGIVPGTYQKLRVSDTGHGMNPETLERIFDPYFTTKEPGQGTGLGLSVVDSIVRDHGGAITVDSIAGVGTTFEVYFPIINAKKMSCEEPEQFAPLGKGQILFVDDETMVTDATRFNLESLGYNVQTENDPVRALAKFEVQPYAFDLVITDMSMPKMTGLELSGRINRIRKDIPIVLITGLADLVEDINLSEYGIRELVMKPVKKAVLGQTLSNILIKQDG
jgi:two-component system cell cycle sensor histidine kinase/response regulator CckA